MSRLHSLPASVNILNYPGKQIKKPSTSTESHIVARVAGYNFAHKINKGSNAVLTVTSAAELATPPFGLPWETKNNSCQKQFLEMWIPDSKTDQVTRSQKSSVDWHENQSN